MNNIDTVYSLLIFNAVCVVLGIVIYLVIKKIFSDFDDDFDK
jgi:hypothetical protein